MKKVILSLVATYGLLCANISLVTTATSSVSYNDFSINLSSDFSIQSWSKAYDQTNYYSWNWVVGGSKLGIGHVNSTIQGLVNNGSVGNAGAVSFNTWVHTVLTYNSSTQTYTLYKNGTAYAFGGTSNLGSVTGLTIGGKSGNEQLNGELDEIAVWNKTLSAAEIASLYNGGLGTLANSNYGNYVSSANLTTYFDFENTYSPTIGSLTPTLNGAAPTYTTSGTLALNVSDTIPNAFSFTPQTNVPFSSAITSSTVTVGGIDAATSISITGGTYSINGGVYTSGAGSVSVGDIVTVRLTSSPNSSTTSTATLTIGGVSAGFSATTAAASVDFNSYSTGVLAGQNGWTSELFTIYASEPTVVSSFGFDTTNAVKFDDVGSGTGASLSKINSSNFILPSFGSGTSVIEMDMKKNYWGSEFYIGYDKDHSGKIEGYSVDEKGIGFVLKGYVDSPVQQLQLLSPPAVLAYTGYVPSSVWFRVRLTIDPSANSGKGSASLAYKDLSQGGSWVTPAELTNIILDLNVSASGAKNPSLWSGVYVHFEGAGSGLDNLQISGSSNAVPNAFSFTPTTNATPSSDYETSTVVSGIGTGVAVTVANGHYRINGGGWTNSTNTAYNGDLIELNVTSSASYSTTTTSTLTVGGVSANFSVTTLGSPLATLVAHFPLDGNISDLLGNKTASLTDHEIFTAGAISQALGSSHDSNAHLGSSGLTTLTIQNPFSGLNSFTISYLTKVKDASSQAHGDSSVSAWMNPYFFNFTLSSGTSQYNGYPLLSTWYVGSQNDRVNENFPVFSRWNHVAITYTPFSTEEGYMNVYLNGSKIIDSVELNSPLAQNYLAFSVRGSDLFDDIKLYGRNLSDSEVVSLYADYSVFSDPAKIQLNQPPYCYALQVVTQSSMSAGTKANCIDDSNQANLTYSLASDVSPSNAGTATVSSNGTISFVPNASFNETATFSYKANDGVNNSNLATVSVRVLRASSDFGAISLELAPTVVIARSSTAYPIVGQAVNYSLFASNPTTACTLTYYADFNDSSAVATSSTPSFSHSFSTSGTYLVSFSAKSCNDKGSQHTLETTVYPALTSKSYSLVSGWNLLSLPYHGEFLATDINDTFNKSYVTALLKYKDGAWQIWVPSDNSSYLPYIPRFMTLNSREGFWLKSSAPATLQILMPLDIQKASDIYPYYLNQGWNLVGVDANDTSAPAMLSFAQYYAPAKCIKPSILYRYDANYAIWKYAVNSLDYPTLSVTLAQPIDAGFDLYGEGVWILVPFNGTLKTCTTNSGT